MHNPADEARRQALFMLIGLALLMPRAVKIYRAAGRARQLERDMRVRHARELEDLDEAQLARVADLTAQLAALRSQPAAPAEPAS